MFGRIEHGTRWVASRDDLSSIVSRSLERSAQGQALPSTPPSACYPKTDDKDVNGCARKAPRDYRADHVPGGELLSNDGRHLDLYRGCKVVLSVREWRPRAAGGSFYSAKNNSQKQQPVSCNRISLVVSGVGQSETRKSLPSVIQECWFSRGDRWRFRPAAGVVDGSDDDDSRWRQNRFSTRFFPAVVARHGVRHAPSRGRRVRATDCEPHIETRSRFVSRDARVPGCSLA